MERSECHHDWNELLVHKNGANGRVTAIGPRRFTQPEAYYYLCYRQRFCRRGNTCVHAHSPIERDVWYIQRDHNYTWLQFVNDVSMTTHVSATVRSCFAALRQIRSVHRSLSRDALVALIRALVVTKLDY